MDAHTRELSATASLGGRIHDATTATKLLAGDPAPPGTAMTVRTPAEVMRVDEIRRTRLFAAFVVVVASSALVAMHLLDGDPVARTVHAVGAVLGVTGAVWTLWKLRRPAEYRPRDGVVFGYFCVIAICSGYYFWGDVSAVALLVPIGIYFFALGDSFAGALSLLALELVLHAAASLSVMLGWGPDRGLIRIHAQGVFNHAVPFLMVQGICVAAFFLARSLRESTLHSVEQLERAARGIAQREALLAEARAELDEVARVGGPGRYTDQTIGDYRLGVVIGRGAMGEVYEACHRHTGELVAAKLLHQRALAEPNTVERFLREVRIAASLRVPNVVRVIDVPDPHAPIPYLIMERLRGTGLADILRDEPRMPPAAVADMIREVGRGIAAAHAAGIVHRDLKPHNVFRHEPSDSRPIWKVLDFGVSKLIDHSGTLTQGGVVGTPSYMAPEQARGDEVDARCDLYGLGAIAYRALTGRPPYVGADIPSMLYAVVHDMPPRPSQVAALPPAFDEVLAVALAKPPDQRFASPDELADALADAARDRVTDRLCARAAALLDRHAWA